MTGTYDRINNLIHKAIDWDWETMTGNPALEIAGEIDAKDKRIAELEGLLREAETMIKNADVSVNTLTKAGDMLAARLDQALAEVAAKAQHIAELEAWTPISTEPDEIDVPYLVATLDGRVAERVWCRDWMGNAPEFYLRDEDSIGRGEIAYWRKIVPPVPTPMEGR